MLGSCPRNNLPYRPDRKSCPALIFVNYFWDGTLDINLSERIGVRRNSIYLIGWEKMKPIKLPQKNQTQDPRMWAQLYDSYLQRFALSKINNSEVAKDLVQETFLAALTSLGNFQKRSSVKTWLTSILKNKIVDYYRACRRELAVEDIDFCRIPIEEMCAGRKRWSAWSNQVNFNPDNSFEQMEFFEVLYRCLAKLPIRLATIFILHTFVGLSTNEICEDLNISKANCWVMLHRARKFLRISLETKWINA